MGQSHFMPMAGVETVMSIDDGTATVEPAPGGFTVRGRRTGDTIVQAFTAAATHVFVVNVLPPPPRPPGPPPPPSLSTHGPITSWWGDNFYRIRYQRGRAAGTHVEQALLLHGRAGKGEYRLQSTFTDDSVRQGVFYANLDWTSKARDLAFTLGDTSARLYGPLSDGVPLRGVRASRTRFLRDKRGQWTHEVFTGEIRSAADPEGTRLGQPAVGTSATGWFTPPRLRDVRLSFGSSVLGFSTESWRDNPGHAGLLAGVRGGAQHKDGLGLELQSALSLARPRAPEAELTPALAVGAAASCETEHGSHRVAYDANQKGFVSPQLQSPSPAGQRISASASRKLRGVRAGVGASYAWVEDLHGNSGDGLSYQFETAIPVTRQTTVALSGGEQSSVIPLTLSKAKQPILTWTQKRAGAALDHRFPDRPLNLRSQVTLARTETGSNKITTSNAQVLAQRRPGRGDRWNGSGWLGVMLSQPESRREVESALAVDQGPPNLNVNVGGHGQFMQGPFESFGSFGVQTTAMPSFRISPFVNLGVQFTPTTAHQLAVSFSSSRNALGRWMYGATVAYAHHFGNSVKAPPIFEFFSYGTIAGRTCFDENADGACSADEPPLPGIPVILSNGMRTTSDGQGRYRFERLKPGFYSVEVNEAMMRDRGRPTGVMMASFELPVRGSAGHDFGVARACRIEGHVIHDLDGDGKVGAAEPLFAGPLAVATGPAGTFQARVSNVGTFALVVPCGEYDVEIEAASLPAMHSPASDEPVRVTTSPLEVPSVRLLVQSLRTIAGDVFIDGNGNGKKDPGEPVVPGAVVRFGSEAGPTDETGAFLLRSLPAGPVEITVDPTSLPAGLRPGAPVAKSLPREAAAIENVHIPVVPAP